MFFIFRDGKGMRNEDSIVGAFALGMATIAVLLSMSMFYTNIITSNAIGFTMWLLLGHVAAFRARTSASLQRQVSLGRAVNSPLHMPDAPVLLPNVDGPKPQHIAMPTAPAPR